MIPRRWKGRRPARVLLVVLALTVAASACAPDEDTGGGEAGGTVKLGFISPVTGFVAALGTDMRRGWEMYWQQNGGKAGDVAVQTVFEDDTGDPEVALTKARRLVEQEQVQLVAGPILANTAYAVAGYVAGKGLPTVQMTGADDLTQRKFNPLVLRVGYTSSQSNFPAGQWAYDQGHRTAVTICPDYAFGWESCGGFVSAFVKAGGKIEKQVWHPLGTQDFSTYVAQARQANPDVVFIGSAGGPDAILFYKSWTGFGLKDRIPLVGNCCFADQVFLREVGEEALGLQSFTYWSEGRDSPAVQNFVKAYEQQHKEIPSLYAAGAYMMAQVVAEALKKTGGRIEGADFINAARQVSLSDSLYGALTFDDTNNVVGPVYRTRVARRDDGTLWSVVEQTFPEVSQFGTEGKEAFLEHPVFSRDYTGQ
ncbi:MAG TPA: ABC transporter substrate-binding protein [Actinomycetota bacterium]|jgi:branched-chain amino acid transport system substrate-binding protein|nr:ABC transporter substrate-binding protein [Actinomycetota bacterium]